MKNIRITAKRLLCETRGTPNTVWRSEGYTTNGYWMIKTEFEGKIVSKIPTVIGEQPSVLKLIPTLDKVTRLRYSGASDVEGDLDLPPKVLLERENDGGKVLVNGYFYDYFVKDGIEVYQKEGYADNAFNVCAPLILVKEIIGKKEIIGLIMPIRL